MDRGATVENPYASVTIPRAQLKDGFLKYYLGEDLTPDTVIFNPSTLPTYSAWEKEREASQQVACPAWKGQKIQTQESWAQPYNPYASLKMLSGDSPEPFHWKSHEVAATGHREEESCCCPCCRKCCPCCRKCCCVIS
ncbi:cysteine-rich tail protein 1 [Rhineura floridana]|uniref:cysteine-rich tail protein 1 n=1 Tax=Rhineura floridana TaxID=261503 RepID=UPI002AC8484C|nr:cysteine-rich tail protein 1 [Rhineura floridana]